MLTVNKIFGFHLSSMSVNYPVPNTPTTAQH
jgi:hypothetical protein